MPDSHRDLLRTKTAEQMGMSVKKETLEEEGCSEAKGTGRSLRRQKQDTVSPGR
jgi:hypothetical protein